MRSQRLTRAALLLAGLAAGPCLAAQEAAPPPAVEATQDKPAPAEPATKEPAFGRPIESINIINLPGVDVPREGTLTFFVTHRFLASLQNSNFYNFWSLDSHASVGLGMAYVPFRNFEVSFYRTFYAQNFGIYELAGKYQLLHTGPFNLTMRVGNDIREPEQSTPYRSSFFVQAIAALQIGDRVRVTAVPEYLAKTSGQQGYSIFTPDGSQRIAFVSPEPVYRNVFNVGLAASIAVTNSITIHGEVIPSWSRTVLCTPDCSKPPCLPSIPQQLSPGVGWRVSVEKALLRHRFAFTAGNLQETTADQYMVSLFQGKPKNIYIGFNLMRQWKMN